MKKSKIFLSAGALALAVSAMFATKANKKTTAIKTAFIGGTGIAITSFGGTGTVVLTTSKGVSPNFYHTCFVTFHTTSNRVLATVLKTSTGGHVLYHL
jgi:hypothetical protein